MKEIGIFSYSQNLFRLTADFIHLFALLYLIRAIVKNKSVEGVSIATQFMSSMAFIFRYSDIFAHFVSFYNTTFKITYVVLYLLTVILYCVYKPKTTNKADEDKCMFIALFLMVLCYCFPSFVHEDMGGFEVVYRMSRYLEAVAIIPQIYLVYKQGAPNRSVFIYVLMLYIYRSLYIGNWIYRYNMDYFVDEVASAAGVVQLVFYMVYFGVYWSKKEMKNGEDDGYKKLVEKEPLYPTHI